MIKPVYLTIKEACALFRVSRWTIARRIDAGELEAVKDGRRVLIVRASAERYIADRMTPAGAGK